ncbi:MAG: hypothetical protein ABJH81_10780 [Balneola sp.]
MSLFLMPFIGFDTEEAISNEIIQSNVCEDRLDINGLFIQGCLPNNGITCTTIGPDGTISFGLSPWDPTKLD